MIVKLLDKKILHVKIPKNGTHSINKVLKDKDNWNRNYFFGHDPLYVLEKNNCIDEDVFVFCVSRNPFTRFYSQYQQLTRTRPNYNNKNIFDFVNDIKNKKLHPVFAATQVEWISDERENILPLKCSFENQQESNFLSYTYKNLLKNINLKKINKIYKLENMEDFETDFNVKLTYNNFSNYNLIKYQHCFDDEIKKFIVKHYKQDFYNFNYSFDFEESVTGLKNQRKTLFYYG